MNTTFATADALPTILDQSVNQPSFTAVGRREPVDDFCLNMLEADRFTQLLAQLERRSAQLNPDQLASAARELCDRSNSDAAPPCIGQRMRRVVSLSWMVADVGWSPANDAIDVAGLVIDYVRGHDDPIPDQLRKAGRLDDAIVIDTAWPRLASEVESYLDFRRLRRVEAGLRGCASNAFEFTRTDWEQARRTEVALVAHQRDVGERSYLPSATGMFHVH